MTSVPPPKYYFNGIQYNSNFFTSSTSGITMDYGNSHYLARTGAPTSIASNTYFTGDLNISGQTVFNDSIQLDDGTTQLSAYTGAVALAGAYTTTNFKR